MILITSAAYVTPGLVSEFGQLPPCMLPLQNKRLYVHQVSLVKDLNETIIVSLPKNYQPTQFDINQFKELGIKVVFVPINLSLGASVVYVLNILSRFNEPLRILHGDTLLGSIPLGLDMCSVSNAEDCYTWTPADDNCADFVYTGFFSFSSQSDLIRFITEQNYSFVDGIKAYCNEHTMTNVHTDEWFDFGLVNSYYRSKSKLTTQRSFNDLRINKYSVIKRSRDVEKMQAESNWLLSLPSGLKHFIPIVWNYGIEDDYGYYEIEYFYLSSLAELYVFGNNPFFVWKNILDSCTDFINQIGSYVPEHRRLIAEQSVSLYRAKTVARLTKFCKVNNIDMNHSWTINGQKVPCLDFIVSDISKELDVPQEKFVGILHGDFCFSNILYDFKSLSIKVLDPRGRDMNGNFSIYGDIRYDIAKLAHSVIGLYDYIIGGFYECTRKDYSLNLYFQTTDLCNMLKEYFMSLQFAGYTIDELSVYPIMIHLFFSMLPLHSDSPARQQAMFANALRLYAEYRK